LNIYRYINEVLNIILSIKLFINITGNELRIDIFEINDHVKNDWIIK